MQTLDQYVSSPSEPEPERRAVDLVESGGPAAASDIPPSYFVSIGYDGEKRCCYLRFYQAKSHRIFEWYDTSGHRPYCLADKSIDELSSNEAISKNPGFEKFQLVEKYDALRCESIARTKIVAKDPLTIGGKPTGSIRDVIRAWEADIKYVENYIYDNNLEPGMMYEVRRGRLQQVEYTLPREATLMVEELLRTESEEYQTLALEWMRLLECPVPTYLRAAIDIEVFSPVATRIPDAEAADQEVICASLAGSDAQKRVFLLKKQGKKQGTAPLPAIASVEFYETERELLAGIFTAMLAYPVVVTFNGDDFDLRYLYHRAQNLGFAKQEIPIEMGRDVAYLRHGVHIDLYKFFFNRSIQVYAFGQRYRENTLSEVSEAILGRGKIEISAPVSDLDYGELATYCLNDSEITLELTRFEDDLVMKLVTALSRISYMSLEDVSRQGVSSWIRSIMYCHHRKRNYFIPRADEIQELKGGTTTEAVIRGKKYKGAIVVEPRPGVHFNVSVLDFASLYPSIIRNWNLGYETIRCPHTDEQCRQNLIPGTSHWVCKKTRALESLLIGSLRDIRVNWYKPRSKDAALPKSQLSWYRVVSDALKVVLNACFTGDTEVLTPHGKRKIVDLKLGDAIYTLNEKSGQVEIKPVIERQHFVYNGPLLEICSRHVDWKVTDNHELYVGERIYRPGNARIRFSKRKALFEASRTGRRYLFRHPEVSSSATDGGSYERASLWPHVRKKEKLVLIRPNRPWERRFSRGSRFSHYPFTDKLAHSKVGGYYRTTKDVIDSVSDSPGQFEMLHDCTLRVSNFEGHGGFGPWSFDAPALYELIGWYVTEGSIQIGENTSGYRFARITITQHLRHRANRKRIGSTIRRLGLKPKVWRNAIAFSSRLVAEFLRDKCGTGSRDKRLPDFVFTAPLELRKILLETLMLGDGNLKRGYYSTVSKGLADDFQHLAFTLGVESSMRVESGQGRNPIYRIKLHGRSHHVISGRNFRIAPVTGLDVYCVTAQDNHIVYAGRNGKLGWIGQSYGVFGADRFALYCPPVAEATAAIGRYAISETLERARELGIEVLYGDTDSLFLESPDPHVLKKLVDWSKSSLQMELEVDKNYRYLALSSRKKNYLGVKPDGSVDIKGLTGKKRHIPEFLTKAFYDMVRILSGVKDPNEFENAKKRITEIVRGCYLKLRNREYTVEELAFSVMMGRETGRYTKTTPQHVKAAKQLEGRGFEVKSGELIAFVKVIGEQGVKPVQLARVDDIDIQKYMEYLRSTFEQVLDALGVEFEDLVGVKKLESFFSNTE
ncbi:DNA polymerase domain-containing protein [[Eubacterium] cellulosolvens]